MPSTSRNRVSIFFSSTLPKEIATQIYCMNKNVFWKQYHYTVKFL